MQTYESILQMIKDNEENKAQLQQAINKNNETVQKSKENLVNNYNQQILENKTNYDQLDRENAVQKKVNEHFVQEEMQNMGLANSGLNDVKTTAVNRSFNKYKSDINSKRQDMVDSLTEQMNSALDELETTRADNEESIRQKWQENNISTAKEIYKEYVAQVEKQKKEAKEMAEAIAAAQKAESAIIKQNNARLNRNFEGTLSENGIRLEVTVKNGKKYYTYYDENTGKKSTFQQGVNPFTGGEPHKDLLDKKGNYDPSRAFSNGYQPKYVGDYKLDKKEGYKTDNIKNLPKNQNIWHYTDKDGKDRYVVWNGAINKYEEYEKIGEDKNKKMGWRKVYK